jgi:type IV secretory pathway VirB10-like protein
MVNTRLGLVVLGASCLVAAGAGGFLATRFNSTPTPASPPAVTIAVDPASEGSATAPVQETEAVMDEKAPAEQPAPTPAASPEPPRRDPAPLAARPEKPARTRARAAAPTPTPSAARPVPGAVSTRPAEPPPAPHVDPPQTQPAQTASEMPRRIEPVEPLQPAAPQVDELVVSADAVIGLQLKNTVSSETSRVEDRVEAQVSRDVSVDGRVAIPAGSRVLGAVTLIERGGKMRDRARLGVRFHTLVLADGTTLPLQTDTVFREGESPAGSSAAKMGGAAIGGAIIGAIIGGGKGAVIGGATGAGAGTAAVMAGSRRAATFTAGSTVTVRVLSPVTVTVER